MISATWIFQKTLDFLDSGHRLLVHKGGTRSGKTMNTIIAICVYCLKHPHTTVSIYRSDRVVARRTVGVDLKTVLDEILGIYQESFHHKTNAVYRFANGSTITLRGCEKTRLRGMKSNISFFNEANEISKESAKQIKLRTTDKLICDFNPTFEIANHWIGEDIRTKDCILHTSTYNDNPFLAESTIREIESLIPIYRTKGGEEIKDTDLAYNGDGVLVAGSPSDWAAYGRAEYIRSPLLLIPNYEVQPVHFSSPTCYGLDFGYTAESALVACKVEESDGPYKNKAYVKELLYETKLTTQDLINRLQDLNISKNVPLYCDSAEPDRIEQIKRAGYDARKSKKDVQAGLDSVRQHRLIAQGQNLTSELKSYQRAHRDSDKPRTGSADHLCDALRYAIFSHTTQDDESKRMINNFNILNI